MYTAVPVRGRMLSVINYCSLYAYSVSELGQLEATFYLFRHEPHTSVQFEVHTLNDRVIYTVSQNKPGPLR